MQIVNASVFVLDGLIYAAQAFRFVRNLMCAACLLWFAPSLYVGMVVLSFRSLLAIWVAKTGLNVIRALGAFWLWYRALPQTWLKQAAEGNAADG